MPRKRHYRPASVQPLPGLLEDAVSGGAVESGLIEVKPGDAEFTDAVRRVLVERFVEALKSVTVTFEAHSTEAVGDALTASQTFQQIVEALQSEFILPRADQLRQLRSANRGHSSGPGRIYGFRVKTTAVPSIEARAEELGMTVSEYVRTLILNDTGVLT